MSAMRVFEEMGGALERRWRAVDYDESAFPRLAEETLAQCDAPNQVDPWDIVRWVHTATALPAQLDLGSAFGDPPLTLFSGSRFVIDVYFWLDGTTSVHQHRFSGAFQVLLGSSLQTQYEFVEERKVNEHMSVGHITLLQVQLLSKGDIERILPGQQLTHSVFHLDRPSATITIRTRSTPSAGVQFDLHRPYIAEDGFFNEPLMQRKVQTVSLLLATKKTEADPMIGDLAASSDLQTAYHVLGAALQHLTANSLEALFPVSPGRHRFARILARARESHGEVIDRIEAVLDERDRLRDLTARRRMITGAEHRYLLALALNIKGRQRILELVRQRFPDREPVQTIVGWIDELSKVGALGSREPNVLGISNFSQAHLRCLETALAGSGEFDESEEGRAVRASWLNTLLEPPSGVGTYGTRREEKTRIGES
jgi:hypothetical protein